MIGKAKNDTGQQATQFLDALSALGPVKEVKSSIFGQPKGTLHHGHHSTFLKRRSPNDCAT